MLKLGVIGAALGTTISYFIVMILSFYNLKYLKISVRFMKHLTWLLWLLIFNLPTLLLINLIKDNINNYLVIFITIIIVIFATLTAVLTFFGPEKKLVLEIFNRIKKFKL
jgi:O-antigen/teichoic acid export membrane protein